MVNRTSYCVAGFRNNTLYFHSAAEGKKLGLLRKNPRVCFELDCDTEVRTGEKACDFSMRYRSVIGFGNAAFIEATAAKCEALDIIMNHYAEGAFDYPEASVNRVAGETAAVVVVRVTIWLATAAVSRPPSMRTGNAAISTKSSS